MEDALLFPQPQAGKEGQDIGVGQLQAFQFGGAVADFAFAGQKDEYISLRIVFRKPLHGAAHVIGQFFLAVARGHVVHVNVVGAPLHVDDRSPAEKL